jgi:16S rRNA (uracil1498-N3)-methyltransferase
VTGSAGAPNREPSGASLRSAAAHVVVDDVGRDGDSVVLVDDEVEHHLRRVLRLRDGEMVTVTDLAGRWRETTATGSGDRLALSSPGPVHLVPRPDRSMTLSVAIPKGDRLDWMVQKVTELGVDRIVLLHADRSTTRWDADRAAIQLRRLGRIAVEACRQSRRVWGVTIEGPVDAVTVLPGSVIGEPGGRRLAVDDTSIAIGPEGGWSGNEIAAAGDTVRLGPNILRVETAAVAATALCVGFGH